MKRRQFLPLVGGGVALLAGCATRASPTRRAARIDAITLVNEDSVPHEVTVRIEADEAVVFSQSYRLGAGTATAKVRERAPLPDEGDYLVHAVLDGGDTVVAEPSTSVKRAGQCAHVWFLVDAEGALTVEHIDSSGECTYL
jgi:hypothetical protein